VTTLTHRPIDDAGLEALLEPNGQSLAWSLDRLGDLLRGLGASRVLAVVSRDAISAANAGARLRGQMSGFEWVEFDAFSPNPTSEQGAEAARAAASITVDAVVGVGGGSCLDVAKIAALGARTPGLIDRLARGEPDPGASPLPIVAAPTTAGTGSEATHFAAIYVEGRKVSVAHPLLRPAGVVLDLSFHLAMPAGLAAATGLDALGQAMESLWAVGSTDESASAARAAGAVIGGRLEASVRGGSPEDRRAMMVGAHLAGRAINISKTTASHALSYVMTQQYGLPHGLAVALTLGALAETNAGATDDDCIHPGGPAAVRRSVQRACAFLNAKPGDARSAIASLLERLGLPRSLREAGVPASALAKIAASIDPVRLGNNPRRLDACGVLALLRASWDPA
jgi:alcohol dehydrogenase class IV